MFIGFLKVMFPKKSLFQSIITECLIVYFGLHGTNAQWSKFVLIFCIFAFKSSFHKAAPQVQEPEEEIQKSCNTPKKYGIECQGMHSEIKDGIMNTF